MSGKVKVGVVGVGALGRHHVRLHNMNPNVELAGIYDANPDVAFAISTEFNVRIYKTIEELSAVCEALSIAVPSHLHHEVAMPLLRDGKHLLIEKPIATKAEDAEDMIRVAKEKSLILGVGHVERFNPVMDYLEGLSSKARFLEVQRLAPYPPHRPGLHPRGTEVSVILDLMIHDLELILHIVNSEPVRVDANGLPAFSDTEDIVNARIQFANGCVANVNASRISFKPIRRYNIFYTDAYLLLDYAKRSGLMHTKDKQNLRVMREAIPVNDHNALEKELEDFVNCVSSRLLNGAQSEMKPRVCGETGLRALKLALEIENKVRQYNREYGFHFE